MPRVVRADPFPIVDGGRTLVETVGHWFVQDGPTDLDRKRFVPGDKVYVTEGMAEELVGAKAVIRSAGRKPTRAPENKAMEPDENKGAG